MSSSWYCITVFAACMSARLTVVLGGLPQPVDPEQDEFHAPCRIASINATDTISLRGMAASKDHWGILYTINGHGDSQNDNVIHAIDAMTGRVVGSISLTSGSPTSWSDLAVGKCSSSSDDYCIYILENDNILKITEPLQPRQANTADVDETIPIQNHEQTTMFVGHDGALYYMNSQYYGRGVTLYKVDRSSDTPIVLMLTSTDIPSASRGPTSADLSPDGTELLILMPDNVYHYDVTNNDVVSALLNQATILPSTPFPSDYELTWSPTGKGYYLGTGDELTGEISLYYSARCADLPIETPTFTSGQFVGVTPVDGLGRISGLAASRTHPGYLYVTIVGSGAVLVVDASNGQVAATLSTSGASWQDVAVSKCQSGTGNCIYVVEGSLVHIIPEPSTIADATVQSESIPFSSTELMFFSNAIMVSPNGAIYLLEWEYQNYITGVNVYHLNNDAGAWFAEHVATFYTQSASAGPEAADISPDGTEMLVKLRDRTLYYTAVHNEDYPAAFGTEPEYLPYIPERRGNSIGWSLDGVSFYTIDSETGELRKYDHP